LGWELVGYDPVPLPGANIFNYAYLLLFKRPFQEGAERGDEAETERPGPITQLPYPCPNCNEAFAEGIELYRHRKTNKH